MKKIGSLLLLLSLAGALLADQSSDQKEIYYLKLRGTIDLAGALYLPKQKGIAKGHISPLTREKLDYTEENDSSHHHHSAGDPGRVIGGLVGEGKLFFSFSFIAPFFHNKHPLFLDNNIEFKLHGGLSPVSMNGGAEIILQPIAFLKLNAGFSIGSGWNIALANGLARNNLGNDYDTSDNDLPQEILASDTFLGPVLRNWFSATFQFDVAALVNAKYKRWTHIVVVATPVFEHIDLLNQKNHLPYEWEGNKGNTLDGWSFKGTYVLGYQIPAIIDERKKIADEKMFRGFVQHHHFTITLAMYLELINLHLTHFNDSPMKDGGWGSDFAHLRFGPNVLLDLPYNYHLLIGFHWSNMAVYTDETVGNAFFMLRNYADWAVCFERITLLFGWDF
ncbi:MAG: hypothetical protein MJB14_12225 [Spirochaetes bacterium]|nr:hypothetical protein [Spirochaetota bacterium]